MSISSQNVCCVARRHQKVYNSWLKSIDCWLQSGYARNNRTSKKTPTPSLMQFAALIETPGFLRFFDFVAAADHIGVSNTDLIQYEQIHDWENSKALSAQPPVIALRDKDFHLLIGQRYHESLTKEGSGCKGCNKICMQVLTFSHRAMAKGYSISVAVVAGVHWERNFAVFRRTHFSQIPLLFFGIDKQNGVQLFPAQISP